MSGVMVARSIGPHRPVPDEIRRTRLIDRLAARWNARVVTVIAPAGYGKSVAIAQALPQADKSRHLDLPMVCDATVANSSALLRQLLAMLGEADDSSSTKVLEQRLVAHLVRQQAPNVCLVIDDVHHLEESNDLAELVGRWITTLPPNVHLVLAGRRLPGPIRDELASRSDVVRLAASEFSFDHAELRALAAHHHRAETDVDLTLGWPAVVRLELAEGPGMATSFLMEEVVSDLDEPVMRGLVAAIAAREADDRILADAVGVEGTVTVQDLVVQVPLAVRHGDRVLIHERWRPTFELLLDDETRHQIAVRVSRGCLERGQVDAALNAAAAVHAWPDAERAVLVGLGAGDVHLSASTTQRWAKQFPADRSESAPARLLRGAGARMSGDLDTARAELDAALAAYTELDDGQGRGIAGTERGLVAWLEGDMATVFRMLEMGHALLAAGNDAMSWLIKLADAAIHDLAGDPHAALEALASIDTGRLPSTGAALVFRWRSTLHLLVGASAQAVDAATRLVEVTRGDGYSSTTLAHVRWQHGDPEPMLLERRRVASEPDGRGPTRRRTTGNSRNDFVGLVYDAVVLASLGEAADADRIDELSTDRVRDRTFVAIARAASLVAQGRDADASEGMDRDLEQIGLHEPVAVGELRRFAALTSVLSEDVRRAIDSGATSGTLAERRALGQLVLDHRAGRRVDWQLLECGPAVLTGLPLRWALELAVAATNDGQAVGAELVTYLHGQVGREVHRHLALLTRAGSADAARLLRVLPPGPGSSVRISTCGALSVTGPEIVDTSALRRARVRELLALLVLRERVHIDAALTCIWPDLAPSAQMNNLRTTLSYARTLLEPDRSADEPPRRLERRDDELRLVPGPLLSVDLWEMRDAIRRGREAERRGDDVGALADYDSVVDRWTSPILPEVRGHHALEPELVLVDRELQDALARAGELALRAGDTLQAMARAQQLISIAPRAERGYQILIAAHLERGEVSAASAALGHCEEALAELGVSPSPTTMSLFSQLRGS